MGTLEIASELCTLASILMKWSPVGGVASPPKLYPHANIDPSDFSAELWSEPAAIATKSFPSGGVAWPHQLFPHAIIDPSDFSAKLWERPTAIATKSFPSGGGSLTGVV